MRSLDVETVPELPRLADGITLLAADERVTGALQSLVLDHLLLSDGHALWVDARGNAATVQLARVAPSRQVLDRVFVARAFTAFQHYSLVEDLSDQITDETTLIVAPAVESFYAEDDLRAGEGEEMLTEALTRLQGLAATADLPVLVTRQNAGGVGQRVADYVSTRLECEITELGPRFSGDDFETLVFRENGYLQTTLAFWRRLLAERHRLPTDQSQVVAYGAN